LSIWPFSETSLVLTVFEEKTGEVSENGVGFGSGTVLSATLAKALPLCPPSVYAKKHSRRVAAISTRVGRIGLTGFGQPGGAVEAQGFGAARPFFHGADLRVEQIPPGAAFAREFPVQLALP